MTLNQAVNRLIDDITKNKYPYPFALPGGCPAAVNLSQAVRHMHTWGEELPFQTKRGLKKMLERRMGLLRTDAYQAKDFPGLQLVKLPAIGKAEAQANAWLHLLASAIKDGDYAGKGMVADDFIVFNFGEAAEYLSTIKMYPGVSERCFDVKEEDLRRELTFAGFDFAPFSLRKGDGMFKVMFKYRPGENYCEEDASSGWNPEENIIGISMRNGKAVVTDARNIRFHAPERQCGAYHRLEIRPPAEAGSDEPLYHDIQKILRLFSGMFSDHAGLLALTWALFAPAKAATGIYPHLFVRGKTKTGKTFLIRHLLKIVLNCDIKSPFYLQGHPPLKVRRGLKPRVSGANLPMFIDECWESMEEITHVAADTWNCSYPDGDRDVLMNTPLLMAGEGRFDFKQMKQFGILIDLDGLELSPRKTASERRLPFIAWPLYNWLDFLAWKINDKIVNAMRRIAEQDLLAWSRPETRRFKKTHPALSNHAILLAGYRLLCEFAEVERLKSVEVKIWEMMESRLEPAAPVKSEAPLTPEELLKQIRQLEKRWPLDCRLYFSTSEGDEDTESLYLSVNDAPYAQPLKIPVKWLPF